MVLIFLVILPDHGIKGSCEFMSRSPSRLSYHSAKFAVHRHSGSRDIMVLVCHVILQDQGLSKPLDQRGM